MTNRCRFIPRQFKVHHTRCHTKIEILYIIITYLKCIVTWIYEVNWNYGLVVVVDAVVVVVQLNRERTNERMSIHNQWKETSKKYINMLRKTSKIDVWFFFVVNNIENSRCIERHTHSVINKIRQFLFFAVLVRLLACLLLVSLQLCKVSVVRTVCAQTLQGESDRTLNCKLYMLSLTLRMYVLSMCTLTTPEVFIRITYEFFCRYFLWSFYFILFISLISSIFISKCVVT